MRRHKVRCMAYNMRVIPEGDYLHAFVTGDNTPVDVLGYLGEIRKTCEEQGRCKVLIEENLAGPPFGDVEVYDVVSTSCVDAAPTVRSIAFVDTNPDHHFATMEFAETVAVNRGIRVRVFRDVPSAAEWIREQ